MKTALLTFCLLVLSFCSVRAGDEIDTKLEKVLYPSVRVTSTDDFQSGGSGTVVYSEDREKSGEFQTFVVTNHHVVARLIHVSRVWDNLSKSYKFEEKNDLANVEIFKYENGGRTITRFPVKADIIAYVQDEDIALLKLRYPFEIKFKMKPLPATKQLRLFQQIYAVGCPLLVPPMFTTGEITNLEYLIDNKPYIGGTANIIWGNSGGAVAAQFDGEWYFCGIPSRGQAAPNGQFVTYLGYYVTPDRIRGFFTTQKLDFLLDEKKTPTQCMAERAKLEKKSEEGQGESGSSSSPYGGHDHEGSLEAEASPVRTKV